MAAEHNDEVLSLKQQLVEKDQELSRLLEEKDILEETLDEQEESLKDIRKTLQKRIDDLTSDIDERDEQIDSLSEEITRLKNNNRIQASDSPATSLKDEIQNKDTALAEMREKLNKGGMTINNLHMEIGELKERLGTANETITSQSAKMKEMRLENSKIKASALELQKRLDSQTGDEVSEQTGDSRGKVQLEVLKKEMERKNEELVSTRIKLEKCQKDLNDVKMRLEESNRNHSEVKPNRIPENLDKVHEKSNSDLQMHLDKAIADYKKAMQALTAIGCLILAYVVAKVIY